VKSKLSVMLLADWSRFVRGASLKRVSRRAKKRRKLILRMADQALLRVWGNDQKRHPRTQTELIESGGRHVVIKPSEVIPG